MMDLRFRKGPSRLALNFGRINLFGVGSFRRNIKVLNRKGRVRGIVTMVLGMVLILGITRTMRSFVARLALLKGKLLLAMVLEELECPTFFLRNLLKMLDLILRKPTRRWNIRSTWMVG